MSTLKKALDKAKAEQRASATPEPPVSTPPAEQPQPFGADPAGPVYCRTRITSLDRRRLLDHRIVAVDETHSMVDIYKLLRTRILHRTRPTGANTILVTGFSRGEGKTTTAANLAVTLAKDSRQTTLLVDLDFRRPSIGPLFGLAADLPGLDTYFANGTPLEDIFVCPGLERLTVLPAGNAVPRAAELMGSPKMEALIRELKTRYPDRYIIFDAPNLNDCPDPLIVAEYVDAILLVARAGHTTREMIRSAMELVPKAKVLGVVLNAAPEASASDYY